MSGQTDPFTPQRQYESGSGSMAMMDSKPNHKYISIWRGLSPLTIISNNVCCEVTPPKPPPIPSLEESPDKRGFCDGPVHCGVRYMAGRQGGRLQLNMWRFRLHAGTPKLSMLLLGLSIINQPFWGTPILGQEKP